MTASLVELLAREAELVQQFVASLNTEQDALKRGDVDGITLINKEKSKLIALLNAAEQNRNKFLRQHGHAATQEGMLEWLGNNRGDHAAAARWSKLLELAAEAREINNLNGQLIAIRLQATNQALATLTQPATQPPILYGPNGHTAPKTGYRIIDAA